MTDAWQEGNDAYWDDYDITHNPYEPGTYEHECWDDGWEDGQETAYQEGS